MLKQAIRKEFMQQRLKLSAAEWQERSTRLLKHFEELPIPATNYLLSYYPLLEKNEFSVEECEQIVRGRNPLLKIAWPKIDQDMLSMDAYLVKKDDLFMKNKYGILEPISGMLVQPHWIDMVFVPLVAVDAKGYRVGYGKGYYDRYLHRCRQEVLKIGFSFFDTVDTIKDIDEFDVPLNICITPSRIYEF